MQNQDKNIAKINILPTSIFLRSKFLNYYINKLLNNLNTLRL